jgi:co-chaperonin GroES (HSP10)
MEIPILPIARKIIVEPLVDKASKGGIILTDRFTDPSHTNIGVVVAIGPEALNDVADIKVGDKIYHPRYAGDNIDIDGKTYRSIERHMISAVCNPKYSIEE